MVRHRLGFILPSANTVFEPEAYAFLPPDASCHFSRAYLTRDDPEQLAGLRESVPRCARELLSANVEIVTFACTTGSLLQGPAYEQELLSDLREAGAPSAITTSTAVADTLGTLGARKISIAAPYEDWLTKRVAHFFKELGFAVLRTRSLGIMDRRQAELTKEQVYTVGREANHAEAEAIFLACTNLPTHRVLRWLQRDLEKPVISSNSATLWRSLSLAQMDLGDPIEFTEKYAHPPPKPEGL